MAGWGCPNEANGICLRVQGRVCDPGMKGCVLFGRFVFSNTDKNRPGGPREREKKDRSWQDSNDSHSNPIEIPPR
uniref:Uncharacterized protein n=1 Tax=Candidatus Kentrum sp. LPFa TaxID=2126335 RepID=A0A450WYD6_9GAMM|nr:MAG: hypothetical protein BECKLPF1236B_GA0070989_12911 [Candidatus Kentron sp. LPFa]